MEVDTSIYFIYFFARILASNPNTPPLTKLNVCPLPVTQSSTYVSGLVQCLLSVLLKFSVDLHALCLWAQYNELATLA